MSMSLWVGGDGPTGPVTEQPGPWRVYRRFSDMVDPGPSDTFVFLDVREDSINTGAWGVMMNGYPDPALVGWTSDWPASYHNRAGGFSFADGHSEIHRWLDPRTMPPLVKGSDHLTFGGWVPSPNNRDLVWLQEHATR
jgi:prepilin-type processing-associated H-X9-DG protein